MTRDEVKTKVLQILGGIAPEADLQSIKADTNLRDQLDIDSMDYLNFVIALDEEFKANIPDSAFTKFTTLNGCIEQLESYLSSN
jgi:acyl carrier protein